MSFSNIGGRKQRNIRDNLFVLYASINDVINGGGTGFDIQGYDVMKCFDEMWFEETLNDLWDVNIQNDKFALISKLDEQCKAVVKTPCGTTDMFELNRIVLQGSVFGPIKCSVQMDTLGRDSLKTGLGIFKYKNSVDVPALAMIDDVMGMAICGDQSIELNAIINSKMESKKLRLSHDKCYKIHICKKSDTCSQVLRVHDNEMKTVSQATYLGDVLCEKGTIDETINKRSQKALGIISQINSILSTVSLGSFHFDIAMVLRDALFVNSVMVNSEVWHNVQMKHVLSLEQSDLNLMKKILNSHSKTASEAYYLELAKYPLRFTLSKRRLMYLWHLLHRDTNELIYKIYQAQKLNENRGDWVKILNEERFRYGIVESDEEISQLSKNKFKKVVQEKIQKFANKYLHDLAKTHKKSAKIENKKFVRQLYFADRRFSREDIQLLFALRTRTINVKQNFKSQYENMNCRICKVENSLEDEEHILHCGAFDEYTGDIMFNDVYGNIDKQFEAVKIYKKVIRRREVYLKMEIK